MDDNKYTFIIIQTSPNGTQYLLESLKILRTYENKKLHDSENGPNFLNLSLPNVDSNVSRYERTRKPKKDEEFCNLNEYVISDSKIKQKTSPVINNSIDIKTKPDSDDSLSINIPEENLEDATEVLKIVANSSPDSNNFINKPLKTYGNRKSSKSFDNKFFRDFPSYPEELECSFNSDYESNEPKSDSLLLKVSEKSIQNNINSAIINDVTQKKLKTSLNPHAVIIPLQFPLKTSPISSVTTKIISNTKKKGTLLTNQQSPKKGNSPKKILCRKNMENIEIPNEQITMIENTPRSRNHIVKKEPKVPTEILSQKSVVNKELSPNNNDQLLISPKKRVLRKNLENSELPEVPIKISRKRSPEKELSRKSFVNELFQDKSMISQNSTKIESETLTDAFGEKLPASEEISPTRKITQRNIGLSKVPQERSEESLPTVEKSLQSRSNNSNKTLEILTESSSEKLSLDTEVLFNSSPRKTLTKQNLNVKVPDEISPLNSEEPVPTVEMSVKRRSNVPKEEPEPESLNTDKVLSPRKTLSRKTLDDKVPHEISPLNSEESVQTSVEKSLKRQSNIPKEDPEVSMEAPKEILPLNKEVLSTDYEQLKNSPNKRQLRKKLNNQLCEEKINEPLQSQSNIPNRQTDILTANSSERLSLSEDVLPNDNDKQELINSPKKRRSKSITGITEIPQENSLAQLPTIEKSLRSQSNNTVKDPEVPIETLSENLTENDSPEVLPLNFEKPISPVEKLPNSQSNIPEKEPEVPTEASKEILPSNEKELPTETKQLKTSPKKILIRKNFNFKVPDEISPSTIKETVPTDEKSLQGLSEIPNEKAEIPDEILPLSSEEKLKDSIETVKNSLRKRVSRKILDLKVPQEISPLNSEESVPTSVEKSLKRQSNIPKEDPEVSVEARKEILPLNDEELPTEIEQLKDSPKKRFLRKKLEFPVHEENISESLTTARKQLKTLINIPNKEPLPTAERSLRSQSNIKEPEEVPTEAPSKKLSLNEEVILAENNQVTNSSKEGITKENIEKSEILPTTEKPLPSRSLRSQSNTFKNDEEVPTADKNNNVLGVEKENQKNFPKDELQPNLTEISPEATKAISQQPTPETQNNDKIAPQKTDDKKTMAKITPEEPLPIVERSLRSEPNTFKKDEEVPTADKNNDALPVEKENHQNSPKTVIQSNLTEISSEAISTEANSRQPTPETQNSVKIGPQIMELLPNDETLLETKIIRPTEDTCIKIKGSVEKSEKPDFIDEYYDSDSSIESPMFEKHSFVESPVFQKEDPFSLAQKIIYFNPNNNELDFSKFEISKKLLSKEEVLKIINQNKTIDLNEPNNYDKIMSVDLGTNTEENIISNSGKSLEDEIISEDEMHEVPLKKLKEKSLGNENQEKSPNKRSVEKPPKIGPLEKSPLKKSTQNSVKKGLPEKLQEQKSIGTKTLENSPKLPKKQPEKSLEKTVSEKLKDTVLDRKNPQIEIEIEPEPKRRGRPRKSKDLSISSNTITERDTEKLKHPKEKSPRKRSLEKKVYTRSKSVPTEKFELQTTPNLTPEYKKRSLTPQTTIERQKSTPTKNESLILENEATFETGKSEIEMGLKRRGRSRFRKSLETINISSNHNKDKIDPSSESLPNTKNRGLSKSLATNDILDPKNLQIENTSQEQEEEAKPKPKKRGRPRKYIGPKSPQDEDGYQNLNSTLKPRKRGRPRKYEIVNEIIAPIDIGKSLPIKNELSNKKIKTNSFEIVLHQIVWAKVGVYPYWPAMVAMETKTQSYEKSIMQARESQLRKRYHVKFLGDNGKRSWIFQYYLFPFQNRNDLKIRYEDAVKNFNWALKRRHYNHPCGFKVLPKVEPKWSKAVTEAEILMDTNPDERVDKFNEFLRGVKIKQSKRKIETTTTNQTSDQTKDELNMSPSPKKRKIDNQKPQKKSTNEVNEFELVEEAVGPIFNENDNANLPKKIPSNENLSVKSEKIGMETRSPIQPNKKRNINLFKGIPEGNICVICLKPGKVLRCKGVCFGLYHQECDNSRRDKSNGVDLNLNMDNGEVAASDSCLNSDLMNNEEKNIRDASEDLKNKALSLNEDSSNHCENKSVDFATCEKLDAKLSEVMLTLLEEKTKYTESTTDSNLDSIDSNFDIKDSVFDPKETKVSKNGKSVDKNGYKCTVCLSNQNPPCFVCTKDISKLGVEDRIKCMWNCGKFYHKDCLKEWPQTKWILKNNVEILNCPYHNCHTCISDDPRANVSKYFNEKLVKCIKCPSAYHKSIFCIPAGSEILSKTQIICPKHSSNSNGKKNKPSLNHVNAAWCFICAVGGGSLICCENCPVSFHSECLKMTPPDGGYICEECESGRLPLYNEVVWVKLGAYRWWPARILFPTDVPSNIRSLPHSQGDFVVKFFGSHDHYWVNRGRAFLFQDGDTGNSSSKKSSVNSLFLKAIEEARKAHTEVQIERANKTAEFQSVMKPPPFIRLLVNRPVGNVKMYETDTSNTTPCDCDPNSEQPCGPDTDCLNRLLMIECDPVVCAAGQKCQNQAFEKRQYAPIEPFKTSARGWGLKASKDIKKGSFIIEYVGEVITEEEYRKRMQRKHEQKDENYYFLTIDKDRMIDAGPKGNLARFMNHSCSPNCETQKWTVNGDTRVGLFAICDITAETELTFNYNLECTGEKKKICHCGAKNCSGFIGVKVNNEAKLKSKKKKKTVPQENLSFTKENSQLKCFVCNKKGAEQTCTHQNCDKNYHLECLNMDFVQEGQWICPRHNCQICDKRTCRTCAKCLKSYCPKHSDGKIFYIKNDFFCLDHKNSNPQENILKNESFSNKKCQKINTKIATSSKNSENENSKNKSKASKINLENQEFSISTNENGSESSWKTPQKHSSPQKTKNVDPIEKVVSPLKNMNKIKNSTIFNKSSKKSVENSSEHNTQPKEKSGTSKFLSKIQFEDSSDIYSSDSTVKNENDSDYEPPLKKKKQKFKSLQCSNRFQENETNLHFVESHRVQELISEELVTTSSDSELENSNLKFVQ